VHETIVARLACGCVASLACGAGVEYVNEHPEAIDLEDRECSRCSGRGQCGVGEAVPAEQLQGPRFALASLACFVIPLLFALAGAFCYRSSETAQLGGAVAGLTLGMLFWWIMSRCCMLRLWPDREQAQ